MKRQYGVSCHCSLIALWASKSKQLSTLSFELLWHIQSTRNWEPSTLNWKTAASWKKSQPWTRVCYIVKLVETWGWGWYNIVIMGMGKKDTPNSQDCVKSSERANLTLSLVLLGCEWMPLGWVTTINRACSTHLSQLPPRPGGQNPNRYRGKHYPVELSNTPGCDM